MKRMMAIIGALMLTSSALAIAPDGYSPPPAGYNNAPWIHRVRISVIKWLAGTDVVLINVTMEKGSVKIPSGINLIVIGSHNIDFLKDGPIPEEFEPYNKI